MDLHFALRVLKWLGKAIASKFAGTAVTAVWNRLDPALRRLLKTAQVSREAAHHTAHTLDRIEKTANAAVQLLAEAEAEIARLKAENDCLRQKLLTHETENHLERE